MGDTAAKRVGEFCARLPCDPASVPQARRGLRDWFLRLRGDTDLLIDIQLAVTEAVANVVRHAGCDEFEVTARLTEESLIVAVSDPGPGRPRHDPGLGVGKEIIRKLAGSVAYHDTRPGTRVTMRFDRVGLGG